MKNEIMNVVDNNDIIEEVNEVVKAGTGNGLKKAGSVGAIILVGTAIGCAVYKFIKTRKATKQTETEEAETMEETSETEVVEEM